MLITLFEPIQISNLVGMFKYHHKAASKAIKHLSSYSRMRKGFELDWGQSAKYEHETIASYCFCDMLNDLFTANIKAYGLQHPDEKHSCRYCDYPYQIRTKVCSKRELYKELQYFYCQTKLDSRSLMSKEGSKILETIIKALSRSKEIDSLHNADIFNPEDYFQDPGDYYKEEWLYY